MNYLSLFSLNFSFLRKNMELFKKTERIFIKTTNQKISFLYNVFG